MIAVKEDVRPVTDYHHKKEPLQGGTFDPGYPLDLFL